MSQRNEFGSIIAGVFLVFGLHLAAIIICSILEAIFTSFQIHIFDVVFGIGLLGIGISQLIYIIPTIFYLKRKDQIALMKGVIIGAVITALLNGGCWLLFSTSAYHF